MRSLDISVTLKKRRFKLLGTTWGLTPYGAVHLSMRDENSLTMYSVLSSGQAI